MKLVCPYCRYPLPNQQTGCCGEIGHGVEEIDEADTLSRLVAENERLKRQCEALASALIKLDGLWDFDEMLRPGEVQTWVDPSAINEAMKEARVAIDEYRAALSGAGKS